MDKLRDAEAFLAALEQPGRAVEATNTALQIAKQSGDPSKIQNAQNAYAEAIAEERRQNISPRDIAVAAQAVLDARGEAHTETGVLPPNHGINTIRAEKAVIRAREDELPAAELKAAQENLADARAADDAGKLAHAEEQHAATVATLKGETSE